MMAAEAERLKELEDENRRLKQLVADLRLDNQMLKHVALGNSKAHRGSARRSMREWHVDFSKAFQHITFGLPSWFHETIVWFGSTFFSARLITVGPIGDAMDRDGVKQLLVEVHADCQVMLALESDHWLEGFERLDRPFEAD